MVEPGDKSHIWWDGNWVFVDIGFSHRSRSCGLIFGDAKPCCFQLGDAKREIVRRIRDSRAAINLVIEAPLSVCFDSSGNPKGRRFERDGASTRYWYNGPGCVVMVAAMYLLRDISDESAARVRLFEGFVSYKDKLARSNHEVDVSVLREVVRNPNRIAGSVLSAEELKADPTDVLRSAFCVAGFDCGIPAVISAGVNALR